MYRTDDPETSTGNGDSPQSTPVNDVSEHESMTESTEPSYQLLIADDHPLFREAMADVVCNRYPDAEILEAENLESAVELAEANEDLDLILLDLNMPGMNGLNGLIQLRNESPTIPVVIISAEEDKNKSEHCIQSTNNQ